MTQVIDELKSLVPTPAAKWSIVLTGTLLIPAFQAPVFLKPFLWTTTTERELLLLQLLATILVLLIGSLITLVLVIRAYHDQVKSHKAEIEKLEQKHNEYVALLCKPSPKKQDARI